MGTVQGRQISGGTWNSSLGIDGSHNVDADPLFVTAVDANNAPTTAGSLALRPGSPAADSAAATYCPDADIRGVARPQGAACDMGAYERVTLVLAGTATGSNTVELSWTVTGYGPYDLWQSSQPYGGYSATVSGLAGPTHTRNVNGMTFFEVHAEGTGEVSNRVGVVPFVLVPGQ